MKSTKEQMKQRGLWLSDYEAYTKNKSGEALLAMLQQHKAWLRTAAAHELTKRKLYSSTMETAVLQLLEKEPALYTRLALCDYLKQGNSQTLQRMLPYLGKYKNHQYHTLPDRISKKKSYPLARDIIARTIAQMDTALLPDMMAYLWKGNEDEVSELLDAVGYQLFYHRAYADEAAYEVLVRLMKAKGENEVIFWKCIMCLSAFSHKECAALLLDIMHHNQGVIKEEAEKSLKTIRSRNHDTL